MITLLTFGTIWFWLFITIAIFLITYSIDAERDGLRASSVYLTVSLVALYFLGNSEFFKTIGKWIIANPGNCILIVLSYLIIGTVWSIVKWFFHIRQVAETYVKQYQGRSIGMGTITVDENKELILTWMIYWPLSSIWTLINDPVKRMFKEILRKYSGVYDSMARKIISNVIEKNNNNTNK